jgi:hypothetical protein
MKWSHVQHVARTLMLLQKVAHFKLGESMLQKRARHEPIECDFLFTVDESWTSDACGHRTMSVDSPGDIGEIKRLSHFGGTTGLAIVSN